MSLIRARHAAPAPAAAAVAARVRAQPAPVVVVTLDAHLEATLRQAVPATPIRVATTPAALADLLMSGEAGALVLDTGALGAAALTVARHLAEQFPDVPLVAVGAREDEARLAGLISRGLVYRFLHRPVSAARARNFIDAALRRSGEIGVNQRLAAPAAVAPAMPVRRPLLALVAIGALAALLLGFWLALRPPPSAGAAPRPAPRPATSRAVASAASPAATAAPAAAPAAAEPAVVTAAPAVTAAAITAAEPAVAAPVPVDAGSARVAALPEPALAAPPAPEPGPATAAVRLAGDDPGPVAAEPPPAGAEAGATPEAETPAAAAEPPPSGPAGAGAAA